MTVSRRLRGYLGYRDGMSAIFTTLDDGRICEWADNRGAEPAVRKGTGALHLRFEPGDATDAIGWDEFFERFAGLLRLSRAVGLDCGELDVLRDSADGRIYVVDVANTPYGLATVLADAGIAAALQLLADAVQRRLIRRW